MAHYEKDDLGVSFDLSDTFTVREQLAFRSKVYEQVGQPSFVRYWAAAQTVMTNWQCEAIPEPGAFDLDGSTDGRAADIITWTANTVAAHMNGLETPGKNS